MSTKKKNDRTDLTRVEDLSEFEHLESDAKAEETRELKIDPDDELTLASEDTSEVEETYDHDEMMEGVLKGSEFQNISDQLTDDIEEEIDEQLSEEDAIDELSLGDDTPLSIGSDDSELMTDESLDAVGFEKTEEIFEDVKVQFENSWPMHIPQESLPSYSVKIGNIISEQDREDLEIILRELEILKDDNRELILKSIARGEALIPRIGEYLAIYLTHKIRKFDFDISLGISEQIHPSIFDDDTISYSAVTPKSHRLNRHDSGDLRHQSLTVEDVLLSTLNQIEDFKIVGHYGIAVETKVISTNDLLDESNLIQFKDTHLDKMIQVEKPELKFTYQNLANLLKVQAIKQKGNGILGLSFHLTPLIGPDEVHQNYQITCTGNIVWLEKK